MADGPTAMVEIWSPEGRDSGTTGTLIRMAAHHLDDRKIATATATDTTMIELLRHAALTRTRTAVIRVSLRRVAGETRVTMTMMTTRRLVDVEDGQIRP